VNSVLLFLAQYDFTALMQRISNCVKIQNIILISERFDIPLRFDETQFGECKLSVTCER